MTEIDEKQSTEAERLLWGVTERLKQIAQEYREAGLPVEAAMIHIDIGAITTRMEHALNEYGEWKNGKR